MVILETRDCTFDTFSFIEKEDQMFLQLCAISLLLGSIQAFTKEDANLYMDRVLNDRFVEEAGYSRLDPYKMGDFQVTLNNSDGVAGRAVLNQGKLINLSKVRRSANCTVPFYQSSNVTFTCFLRFDKMQVHYTANITYEKIVSHIWSPIVQIEGTNITVQATSNHKDDVPNLKLLFINRIGRTLINTDLSSLGNLGYSLLEPVRETLGRKTITTLHQAVRGRFKDALAYSIYKTPFGLDK